MRCFMLCLVLVSAFVQGAEASTCTTKEDCFFSSHSCIDGMCVRACTAETASRDCFSSESCVNGGCFATCAAPSDCFGSEGCVSGTCQDACTSDAECDEKNTYTCDASANNGKGKCTYKAGCECGEECQDSYYGKILGGSIAGVVVALVFIVAVAIPCCCGKDFDQPMCPKILGGLAIVVGILCCFIPLMASGGAADGATEDICKKCDSGCTDEEKEGIRSTLGGLGFIVAYTCGCGWMASTLGLVASCMGCCALCACCGPLKDKQMAAQQMPPSGAVIGQAVNAQPAKE